MAIFLGACTAWCLIDISPSYFPHDHDVSAAFAPYLGMLASIFLGPASGTLLVLATKILDRRAG